MTTKNLLACLSLVCAAAACTPTPDGYSDSAGIYHDNLRSTEKAQHPGQEDRIYTRYDYPSGIYGRAGYYDMNGIFISALDSGPRIDRKYLPPKGACRVWFTDRFPDAQPAAERCVDVYGHVPSGAFVVYGG